jgi:hypothetical protein
VDSASVCAHGSLDLQQEIQHSNSDRGHAAVPVHSASVCAHGSLDLQQEIQIQIQTGDMLLFLCIMVH